MRTFDIRTIFWVSVLWVLLLLASLIAQRFCLIESFVQFAEIATLKRDMDLHMSDRVIYDSKMDAVTQQKRIAQTDYLLDETVSALVSSSDSHMSAGDIWLKAMRFAEYLSFRQKHPRIYVFDPSIHTINPEFIDAEIRGYIAAVCKTLPEDKKVLLEKSYKQKSPSNESEPQ